MAKDEFETSLRHYIYREPFRPFVIEFSDGRQILIKQLPVVFSDGAASFIDSSDGALVDFSHEKVRTFGPWEQEVPA